MTNNKSPDYIVFQAVNRKILKSMAPKDLFPCGNPYKELDNSNICQLFATSSRKQMDYYSKGLLNYHDKTQST